MKKKVITKTLSIILSLVMVITGLPLIDIDFITTTNAKTISEYNVGDIIEFGSYPQTKVTDEKLLDELNKLNLNWISYGYYIKRQKSDYMMYADVNYNGIKYRAVKFSQYRPVATVTYTTSRQEYNSLDINTTYWFKYEPLQWRVLDPDEGFLLCEKIIDSQAFNDTNTDDDYLISSIRDWINKEFYDTAFTAVEKSKIQASHYDGDANYDKIFLLSYDEVINSDYGFSSKASNKGSIRSVFGTDYAKVQGLYVVNSTASGKTYVGRSNWWLRSPSSISVQVSAVNHDGTIDTAYIHSTDVGIRPALNYR